MIRQAFPRYTRLLSKTKGHYWLVGSTQASIPYNSKLRIRSGASVAKGTQLLVGETDSHSLHSILTSCSLGTNRHHGRRIYLRIGGECPGPG